MHARHERFEALGARVVFVAFDSPDALRKGLIADVDLRFPVAADESLRSYAAWGLHRAPWATIWLDPAVWWNYLKLLGSGERLRAMGRDPLQLGGDFVIDPQGRVAWARPQERDDRPPVGEILRAVASAREV